MTAFSHIGGCLVGVVFARAILARAMRAGAMRAGKLRILACCMPIRGRCHTVFLMLYRSRAARRRGGVLQSAGVCCLVSRPSPRAG